MIWFSRLRVPEQNGSAVVCTAVYTQDFAQDFDVVLESELMNGV